MESQENLPSQLPSTADATTAEESSGVEVSILQAIKNCVVCGKEGPPYKCPTCLRKYCSVNCCKVHKTDPSCLLPVKVSNNESGNVGSSSRKYFYPTRDTVPPEKLRMLTEGDNLTQLRQHFENPTVRSGILKLDSCEDPITAFAELMEDERFVQFSAFVTNELSKTGRENTPRLLDN